MPHQTGCVRASMTWQVFLASMICWSLACTRCTSRAILLPPDGQPDQIEDGGLEPDTHPGDPDQGEKWPPGSLGGPCAEENLCEGELTCEISEQYPTGLCVQRCSSPEGCPDGFVCVEMQPDGGGDPEGWCLAPCQNTDGCRPELTCSSRLILGTGQSEMVCQ